MTRPNNRTKRRRRSVKTRKGPASMRAYMKDYTGTLDEAQLEELFRHVAYGEDNFTSEWLKDKPHQVILRLLKLIEDRRR